MSSDQVSDAVIRIALAHVRTRLDDEAAACERPGRCQAHDRQARWMVLWACCAAYPPSRPADWAPRLGLEADSALIIVGRLRGMTWWRERLVVEALVMMAAAT